MSPLGLKLSDHFDESMIRASMRMKAESRLKLLRDQLLLSPDLIELLQGSSEKSTDSSENRST